MPANNTTTDVQLLEKLLKDKLRWGAVVEVLRETFDECGLSQQQIADELEVSSQSGISRLLNGEPPPNLRNALRKSPEGLSRLLTELGLAIDELMKRVVAQGLLLCIDRGEDASVQCPSVRFRAAGDYAVPIPMDPRFDRSEEFCPFCLGMLSAECPNPKCKARVVAASYCPACGHRYVAGVPEELRGLTGKALAQACEIRNAKNRVDRKHAQSGPLSLRYRR